jgi:hypothetical protein
LDEKRLISERFELALNAFYRRKWSVMRPHPGEDLRQAFPAQILKPFPGRGCRRRRASVRT